ncbi:MAG: threonine synthase [Thermotogota bacterium]|nr:threonine synthase [Thermotogota bacterium]MDK2863896.1 threonine synthase [Thermotogota bacterium]
MTPLILKYRDFLPVSEETPVISLGEGNTPLIRAKNIEKLLGTSVKLFLKFEGTNPTGSFKDRGMTMAISKAVEKGAKFTICASTGNTAASAAAYSARAGISSVVLIPKGKIALGKLAQAIVYGARVVEIEGNFDDCLRVVRELVDNYPFELVNSLNPYRIEGQKTAAFEIVDQLGDAPDYHFIPVGNAGNITAYWKGYREYREAGKSKTLPKMVGFQASGAAPIVLGHVVENPETVATAIRIGNPVNWKTAVAAAEESGGEISTVTDEEILEAQSILASREGVFCEPASAASVAGFIKKVKEGFFEGGELVVATLTGHGLKDPNVILHSVEKPPRAKPTSADVLDVIGWKE